MDEPAKVLVAYASALGSTRGVAERIAARLAEHEFQVEVQSVDRAEDVGAYDAVVIGSPIYNGAWLPQADQFVQSNQRALAGRPVWMFSVAAFGDRRRVLGSLMKREPKNIRDLRQAVAPRDYRVFAAQLSVRSGRGWGGSFSEPLVVASATTESGR